MVVIGVWHSILFLAWACLLIAISLEELRATRELFKLGHYSMRDFAESIPEAVAEVIFSAIILLGLIQGLWAISGRMQVTLDKASGVVTKLHRLLFFTILERTYDIRKTSAVTFDRATGVAKLIGFHHVCLHTEKPLRLFLFLGSRSQKEGREMANEIASFLGVPGPESAAS